MVSPSPARTPAGAHRSLVEALGDDAALQHVSPLGWLSAGDWSAALERARCAKFPELSPAEAYRALGRLLGERFWKTEIGQLVGETVPVVAPERLWAVLVPSIAERLRKSFEVSWVPETGGGVLQIHGPRAAPAELSLGFFEAMAEMLKPPPAVSVARADDQLFELRVRW